MENLETNKCVCGENEAYCAPECRIVDVELEFAVLATSFSGSDFQSGGVFGSDF